MSGHFVGVTDGLSHGYGEFVVCFAVTTVGYLCLTLCLGELASEMPFCGGAYGYARIIFGIIPALFIGLLETLEYLCLQVTTLYLVGELFTTVLGTDPKQTPWWWVLVSLLNFGVQLCGGRVMYGVAAGVTLVTLAILLIFVGGTVPHLDFRLMEFEPMLGS